MKNARTNRPNTPPETPKRLQVDLTAERMAAFDALIDEGGLKTRKDVFDYAMSILYWAVEEARKGNDVASVNQASKEISILRTPMLDHVKKLAEKHRVGEHEPSDWEMAYPETAVAG